MHPVETYSTQTALLQLMQCLAHPVAACASLQALFNWTSSGQIANDLGLV
jgi:hypothetical protein